MIVESEKLVERKLVEAVKAEGGLCIKLECNLLIGLPDRMCLFPNGKIVFVELKTTGKPLKKIQQVRHNKLKNLGFTICVCDTVERAKEIAKIKC